MSFGADLYVILSTQFEWSLLRRSRTCWEIQVFAWHPDSWGMYSSKWSCFERLNVYITSPAPAVSLFKPSPIYLHYLLLWTYSVNLVQFGHTVTVHVQHRWQMNMNKLLHIFKHVRLIMDTYSMFSRSDLSVPNGYFYGYWTTVQTDTAFTPAGMGELLVK